MMDEGTFNLSYSFFINLTNDSLSLSILLATISDIQEERSLGESGSSNVGRFGSDDAKAALTLVYFPHFLPTFR